MIKSGSPWWHGGVNRQRNGGLSCLSGYKESKRFFFEKKNQKTFRPAVADSPAACAWRVKHPGSADANSERTLSALKAFLPGGCSVWLCSMSALRSAVRPAQGSRSDRRRRLGLEQAGRPNDDRASKVASVSVGVFASEPEAVVLSNKERRHCACVSAAATSSRRSITSGSCAPAIAWQPETTKHGTPLIPSLWARRLSA